MNNLKRLTSLLLALVLIFGLSINALANAHSGITLLLNGRKISLDEAFLNEENQVMVPLRMIGEELGYEVIWNEDWSVTLSRENNAIHLKIGESKVLINGEELKLEFPPLLKEAKTYVPVEFFNRSMGLVAGWNGKHQILKLSQWKDNEEYFFTMDEENKDKQDELAKYMESLQKYHNFNGSLLVAKNGKILLNEGYGFADKEQKIKNTSQTTFAIGSITKQFTAMAVMQLAEKGLLNVEDKLSKYLPDFPNGDLITIHNLLTHTSGLVSYTNLNEFLKMDISNRSPEAVIDLIKDLPLNFEPGKMFEYSNTNYVLLGMIVEKVSNIPLEKYLDGNIFKPLNMESTGMYSIDKYHIQDATPYVGFLELHPVDDELVLTQAFGAGNMYSTVEDLYRWDRALKTEKLISKETLNKIFEKYISIDETNYYGYGWMITEEVNSESKAHHGGNTFGFTANIARYPESDLTIIALSNMGSYDLISLTEDLRAIVLDKEYKMPEILEKIEIDDLSLYDDYTGRYELANGIYINISRVDDKLFAQVTGQDAFQLLPLSESRFFAQEVDIRIEFIKDEEGNVRKLTLKQLGMTHECKKIGDIEEQKEVELDPEIYNDYVGKYELAPGIIITITTEESRLYAQLTGQNKFEIFPSSQDEFFYKVVEAQIHFQRDEKGTVTHLILYQGGQEIPSVKLNE
ncbi:serine hydrolase [Tepidimicrobium xylanilyticum]